MEGRHELASHLKACLLRTVYDIPLPETHETNIGLIGPSNVPWLVRVLESMFGKSRIFQTHAVCHDVFGSIKHNHDVSYGYAYAYNKVPSEFARRKAFMGQLSGLYQTWKAVRNTPSNFYSMKRDVYIVTERSLRLQNVPTHKLELFRHIYFTYQEDCSDNDDSDDCLYL